MMCFPFSLEWLKNVAYITENGVTCGKKQTKKHCILSSICILLSVLSRDYILNNSEYYHHQILWLSKVSLMAMVPH